MARNTRGNTAAERAQLVLAESQILREAGRHNDAYIAHLNNKQHGKP